MMDGKGLHVVPRIDKAEGTLDCEVKRGCVKEIFAVM